jgi:hypothetical protein
MPGTPHGHGLRIPSALLVAAATDCGITVLYQFVDAHTCCCLWAPHRLVETALATLANICEDVGDYLDSDALGRPLNRIVRGTRPHHCFHFTFLPHTFVSSLPAPLLAVLAPCWAVLTWLLCPFFFSTRVPAPSTVNASSRCCCNSRARTTPASAATP